MQSVIFKRLFQLLLGLGLLKITLPASRILLWLTYTQLYFTTKCDSKNRIKNRTYLNLTKQNKNNYSNSLSLQFVHCIFTTHYTVDYYKYEI